MLSGRWVSQPAWETCWVLGSEPGPHPCRPGSHDVVGLCLVLGSECVARGQQKVYLLSPVHHCLLLWSLCLPSSPLLHCPRETLRHEAGVVTAGQQQHSWVKSGPPVPAGSLLHHTCGLLTVCLGTRCQALCVLCTQTCLWEGR